MWEMFQAWSFWQGTGVVATWSVTISLVLLGLIGCIVPFIPGHLLIFLAAVSHRLMLGTNSGVEWWTFVVLGVLLAASQGFEFIAGAVGSKWFGGSKWGALGAFLGGIVGIFFVPWGLIIGPLIGVLGFEAIFAKKTVKPAIKSGIGTTVGIATSLVVRIIVGLVMSAWLFIDILLIHP